jgi:hypothetical protein
MKNKIALLFKEDFHIESLEEDPFKKLNRREYRQVQRIIKRAMPKNFKPDHNPFIIHRCHCHRVLNKLKSKVILHVDDVQQ